MYTDSDKVRGIRELPLYLIDAIRAFSKDRVLQSYLGKEFSQAYIKLKTNDWNKYSRHLTEWERETTLDC